MHFEVDSAGGGEYYGMRTTQFPLTSIFPDMEDVWTSLFSCPVGTEVNHSLRTGEVTRLTPPPPCWDLFNSFGLLFLSLYCRNNASCQWWFHLGLLCDLILLVSLHKDRVNTVEFPSQPHTISPQMSLSSPSVAEKRHKCQVKNDQWKSRLLGVRPITCAFSFSADFTTPRIDMKQSGMWSRKNEWKETNQLTDWQITICCISPEAFRDIKRRMTTFRQCHSTVAVQPEAICFFFYTCLFNEITEFSFQVAVCRDQISDINHDFLM